MSRHDEASLKACADVVPNLPRDDKGPVFAQPWQAQAFVMAVQLSKSGHFTWSEWVEMFAAELKDAGPDDGSRYYETWLTTLEKIVAKKRLIEYQALAQRKHDWMEAYLHTPHGQAVHLHHSD